MRRSGAIAASIVLGLLLGACTGTGSTSAVLGGQKLRLYIADTDEERAAGLKGFDGLAGGEAMLFIYPDSKPRTFVMREVAFPIDVVFISDSGLVAAIEPLDPGESRTVDSPGPSRYVLELPREWADAHSIQVGAAFEYAPSR